jgi:glycosyltransferase 2 family protein
MSSVDSPRRRWVLLGLKLTVSVGLLVLLFRQADSSAFIDRFRHAAPIWLLVALSMYAGMVWLSAWRWQRLLKAQSVRVRSSKLSESFLVATFFNNFLPSNIGGDVVRVADTAPLAGSKTLAAAVVLADRGIGLIALFLLAAGGSVVAAWNGRPVPGAGYLWLIVIAASAGGLLILLAPATLPRLLRPLRIVRPEWIDERLARLEGAMQRFRHAPVELAWAFAGAIIVQALLVAFYLFAAWGLHVPLPVMLGFVIVPVSLAVQMVPVSINGFGVREAVFSYFFIQFGLGVDAALALSLTSAALIMLFSMSGGILFLLRRGSTQTFSSVRYEA